MRDILEARRGLSCASRVGSRRQLRNAGLPACQIERASNRLLEQSAGWKSALPARAEPPARLTAAFLLQKRSSSNSARHLGVGSAGE